MLSLVKFISVYNAQTLFVDFSCLHVIQVTSGFHVGFGEVYSNISP